MKKLPWSSMTSGFLRNFLVLLLSCARTLAAVATRRTAKHRHLPTRCRKRRSHVMELSSALVNDPAAAPAGTAAPGWKLRPSTGRVKLQSNNARSIRMLDSLLRTDEDLIPASNRCRVHRVNTEVIVIGRFIWPVHSGAKRGATLFPREQLSTPGELKVLPRHCMFLAGTPCRSHIMRTILVCLSAVMALGITASHVACSRDNEAVQAADTSIAIETSPMSVTIENKAGGPLLDVTVAIQTPGPTY